MYLWDADQLSSRRVRLPDNVDDTFDVSCKRSVLLGMPIMICSLLSSCRRNLCVMFTSDVERLSEFTSVEVDGKGYVLKRLAKSWSSLGYGSS